jgi:hypothetical protein
MKRLILIIPLTTNTKRNKNGANNRLGGKTRIVESFWILRNIDTMLKVSVDRRHRIVAMRARLCSEGYIPSGLSSKMVGFGPWAQGVRLVGCSNGSEFIILCIRERWGFYNNWIFRFSGKAVT